MTKEKIRGSNRAAFTATVTVAMALAGGVAAPVNATDGYFSSGTSVESKGLAGAGVAIDTGLMGLAANPAMGVQHGGEATACLGVFSPKRSVTMGGTYDSNNNYFLVPCAGANFRLNDRSTLGVLIYGNGGMNTEYDTNFFGGTSPLGINLEQLFVAVNYSYQINDQISVGIAPVFAAQRFSATGLEPFMGMSMDPANVTNNGDSWSTGFGLQVGAVVQASPNLTFGISYRSRIWMSPFEDYSGLFAEGGDFDIPPTASIGVSFTPPSNPDLTLTAEWQRIFYSNVASIANTFPAAGPLGADDGPGFGWVDMDVVRVGAEWQASPKWTLRGGVSYNTAFTDSSQATLNSLAPATVQWHASIGATMHMAPNKDLSISYTHAFNQDLTGPFAFGGTISEQMSQDEIAVGMTWKW